MKIMIMIYILLVLIGILSIAGIILNFAEIAAFFRFALELFREGYYAESVFGVIIAIAMIIALLTPAIKEMRKDKSRKD